MFNNTELVTLLTGNGSALAVGVWQTVADPGPQAGLEGRDLGQVGEVTR
jgi:hypothetical protein